MVPEGSHWGCPVLPFVSSLVGIDTNVLLRYLLRDDEDQYLVAESLFYSFTPQRRGFITQVTLVETYWVLSRSLRIPRDACLAMMRQLIMTPTLECDDGEGMVRAITLAEEGADFADALIQGVMELFGVDEIATFDKDAANRLGWSLLTA